MTDKLDLDELRDDLSKGYRLSTADCVRLLDLIERLTSRIEFLGTRSVVAENTLADAIKARDAAYTERNRLVAHLSRIYPACLERHPEEEEWDDDWRWIVFIDSPEGQLSWHIHDSELGLFGHLLQRGSGNVKWDGHTTGEKYDRLARIEGSK